MIHRDTTTAPTYTTPASKAKRTDTEIISLLSTDERDAPNNTPSREIPKPFAQQHSFTESHPATKLDFDSVKKKQSRGRVSETTYVPDAGKATFVPQAVRVTSFSHSHRSVCEPTLSVEDLMEAPATIARVQQLISHLMIMKTEHTTTTTTPRTPIHNILIDQCRSMLLGLHKQLDLFCLHVHNSDESNIDE